LFVDKPELLRAFRAGERDALERVYWAYVDAVAQVARYGARLGERAAVTGAPREDWGDLVQETFSRAFGERARLAYDGLRPYRPYLLTICRNLLAEGARRRGGALPAHELAVVEKYVAGLEARLAAVYRQRYIAGATQEEAARALGLSRQQLRTLEEKLRRGLRRALEKAK